VDLKNVFPKLDEEGIDLCLKFLQYAPELRISADQALLRNWVLIRFIL
jgi:hypothetical protein